MENQLKHYLHIQLIKKLAMRLRQLKYFKKERRVLSLDLIQKRIINLEELISKIIGIYDLLEYYYCIGNIEKLKTIIKSNELEIENYFLPYEIDKYQMMINRPNNI